MQKHMEKSISDTLESQNRRKAIKKIAVGVGALATYSALPAKWISPVVGTMVLPAHAATSGEEVIAASEKVAPSSADEDYNSSETFSMTAYQDRSYTWLPKTGAAYGGPVKFVFSGGCGELIVPDAAQSHGTDGNVNNHAQALYFCGTDFPPGAAEYNDGRASVFTPPGCQSSTVTIFYNT